MGLDRVPDVELHFTRPSGAPADVVFLTGPMAAGKTTALETVFAAREGAFPSAPMAPWEPHGRDGGAAKLLVSWSLDDALLDRFPGERERELEAIFDSEERFPVDNDPAFQFAFGDEDTPWGRLEYFHARRRGARLEGASGSHNRSSRSLDKYGSTAHFLTELVVTGDSRQGVLNEAIKEVGCTFQLDGVFSTGNSFMPELSSPTGRPRGVSALSDGEHDVLMVLATAIRFQLGAAPIFIDIPELTLGAERAARLLHTLRGLTNAQLVCASRNADGFRSLDPVVIACGVSS
jgi:hypothetical protein